MSRPLDTAAVHDALAADLRRWAARRVPADRVDDVVQETFVRVHDRLPTLRDPDRVAPWVFRIARSVVVDDARARGRLEPLEEAPAVPPVTPGPHADSIVAAWLPGIVASLPEPYREAVRLSELEGWTQAAVARELGLSPSGARSRVQRGRRMVREALEACCEVAREGGSVVDWRPRQAGCGCEPG